MGKPKVATTTGTFGGIHYMEDDKPRDPEAEEAREPKRFRPEDALNKLLTETLGDMGPWITDQQFAIQVTGLRDRDITFDRCYPMKKLLIQRLFTRRKINEPDKVLAEDIEEYSSFAKERGYTFLAVIDDKIEPEELRRVQRELKVAA